MTRSIDVAVSGRDQQDVAEFASLVFAWLKARGDYSAICVRSDNAPGPVVYAADSHRPMVAIRDVHVEVAAARSLLMNAGRSGASDDKDAAKIGQAFLALLRDPGRAVANDSPVADAPTEVGSVPWLRALQMALPPTITERKLYTATERIRSESQARVILAAIVDLLMPYPASGSLAAFADVRKTADIGSLKSSDIGRLAFLVMQLARHLPAGEVDFVDALIEASKSETPV